MRVVQRYERAYQGPDKPKDFFVGCAAGFLFGILESAPQKSLISGITASTLAAAGKETIDAITSRDWSAWSRADFTATVAGGVIGAALGRWLWGA